MGATYAWRGNGDVGEGNMTVTERVGKDFELGLSNLKKLSER